VVSTQQPYRPPSRFVHAVAATGIALAVGLPLLFVLVRTVRFYGQADSGFGFWIAARILPAWAIIAFLIGNLIGFVFCKGRHPLREAMMKSAFFSALAGVVLLAGVLRYFSPMVEAHAKRNGLPEVPITHVLAHHLFDSRSQRKLTFDACAAAALSPAGHFSYKFCIPDSLGLKNRVAMIDTTLRMRAPTDSTEGPPGSIVCVGGTGQPHAVHVLAQLAELPYVHSIQHASD
jgi:hypothetical protein